MHTHHPSDFLEIVGSDSLHTLIHTSTKILVVDFFADRCGPCQMLGPILHDLSHHFDGKISICKVDVDHVENRELCEKYTISSIPRILIIHHQVVKHDITGLKNLEELSALIQPLVITS